MYIATLEPPKDPHKALDRLTSFQRLDIEFAKMTARIKRALYSNKISVDLLIDQLCATSAVESKKIPIFDEDMHDKVKSIDGLWRKLKWNIFDYDLLILIVDFTDCAEAQEILDNFLARIDPTALDLDLVLNCEVYKEKTWPVLRIKVNAAKCTLDVKNKVKEIVSKRYDLQKYALHFIGIKEGCIEFVYHISKAVQRYLLEFKVNTSIKTDFAEHNIISLHINEIH